MSLYEDLLDKKEKMSVIGLGYVGIQVAVAFAKKVDVVGFDISKVKIKKYKQGIDSTMEVGNKAIKETSVYFTSDAKN